MRSLPAIAAAAALLTAAAGCRKPALPPPEPEAIAARGYVESGVASHYAEKFAGRRTASGEVYAPRLLTAAHRSLPFGTLVKVTSLDNGRSVVVRVNDRGPSVRGRVIDLSRRAAEDLGMIRNGTARVRIEAVR